MKDWTVGFVIYLIAWGFGRQFSWTDLLITAFFAWAPDLDTIPYAFLRRPFKLVSHWFFHFPRWYFPIGVVLLLTITHDRFYITAFVLGSLWHFLHDSANVQGVRWTRHAYTIVPPKVMRVDEEWRRQFFRRLREGASKRSLWDEIVIRTIRRPT